MHNFFRLAIRSPMVSTFLVGATSTSRADPAPKTDVVARVQLDPVPVPYPSGAQGDALVVLEPPPVEVSVVGERREELGSTHIPRNETRLIPGAFADPFRVVEILPGVAPIVSGLPYFTVRGAPAGDVGYFIDGIRVPLLFHVGAGPSVIAPALVDRVDLFPSV